MRFSNWQNKFTALWLIALLLVAVGLGVTWLNKDIHIQTNIFALLPKVQQDPELARTQQYMNEQLNNKVFVVVDAKDEAAIQQATHFLKAQAYKVHYGSHSNHSLILINLQNSCINIEQGC